MPYCFFFAYPAGGREAFTGAGTGREAGLGRSTLWGRDAELAAGFKTALRPSHGMADLALKRQVCFGMKRTIAHRAMVLFLGRSGECGVRRVPGQGLLTWGGRGGAAERPEGREAA
jgi:hypothetical protein